MDDRSWWIVEPDPPALALPADLRARDPLGGRDCGWVAQMRPFVRQFCPPGGIVLDPFCGFGTTLLAAHLEGRAAIGLEIDPARAALARERLDRHGCAAPVLVGALPARDPGQRVQLCLTNVPYFGCGWRGEAGPDQLYASPSYAQYLDGLRAVFHGVRAQLDDGGHCIAMVENVVVGGRPVPLAHDLARVLGGLFTPCEERVLCYARPAAGLAPGESRSNRSHETALVLRKQREVLDLAAAATLLDALRAAGFAFALHGGYAAWLQHANPSGIPERDAGSPGAPGPGGDTGPVPMPADIDLWLPHDQPQLDRLLAWLVARGFGLSLWGMAVAPELRLETLARYHYVRAERLDARAGRLQLDLSLAPEAAR